MENVAALLRKRCNKCKSGGHESGSNSRLKTLARHPTTLSSVEVDERTSGIRNGSKEQQIHLKEFAVTAVVWKREKEHPFKICFPDGTERKIYEALCFESYFIIVLCTE